MESHRQNDYTIYQIRSFAFAKAEHNALQRLYRLDELRALIGAIWGDKTNTELQDLREEIAGSYLIESNKVVKMSREEMAEHNKKAAMSMKNFIRG